MRGEEKDLRILLTCHQPHYCHQSDRACTANQGLSIGSESSYDRVRHARFITPKRQAMRAATLESRLNELGVLRYGSPTTTRALRIAVEVGVDEVPRSGECRPDDRRKPFSSKERTCKRVPEFVGWHNHRHPHSRIKFVTPDR